jgi:hypothetical protein
MNKKLVFSGIAVVAVTAAVNVVTNAATPAYATLDNPRFVEVLSTAIAGGYGNEDVPCAATEAAIGGGFVIDDPAQLQVIHSSPMVGMNRWQISVKNLDAVNSHNFFAYAVCVTR